MLLSVKDLEVSYPLRGSLFGKKRFLKAVRGVSFELDKGEILGLVGESGCGKSTIGRALVRLEKPSAGSIMLNGVDLAQAEGRLLAEHRKDFQMVFQDPYGSLNPRLNIFSALDEVLKLQEICAPAEPEPLNCWSEWGSMRIISTVIRTSFPEVSVSA